MEKYIPVKTKKDEQSLTEFLNKGWTVKLVSPVKHVIDNGEDGYEELIYNEYIITKPLLTK